MKVGDLKSNPGNPRKISPKKLEILKTTIQKYGDLSGIVFNRRTERLVGGHQRSKVLPPDAEIKIEREFDEPTPRGTVKEGYVVVFGESISYREVDWDDETEKAANIAANTGAGEWDKALLADWMLDLDAKGWAIEDLGWTNEEFEDLCAPKSDEKKEKVKKVCPHCGEKL